MRLPHNPIEVEYAWARTFPIDAITYRHCNPSAAYLISARNKDRRKNTSDSRASMYNSVASHPVNHIRLVHARYGWH